MKLAKIIIGLQTAAFLAISLVGCGSGNVEDEIIGEWRYSSESTVNTDAEYLTFFEGGSAANSGETGTWSISSDTLSVMGTYGGQFFSHDNLIGTVEIDGNTMTITNPCVDGNNKKGELIYIREE